MRPRSHAPRGLRLALAGALLALAGSPLAQAPPGALAPPDAAQAPGSPPPSPSPAAGGELPEPAAAAAPEPARPPASPEEAAIARYAFSEGLRLLAEAARAGPDAPSGTLGRAAESFERAYDADPGLAHAGVNAGILRERMGEDDAARAIYARVAGEHPGFGPAARNLVRLRIRRGELAEGEKEARDRLARAPDLAAPHDALAEVLLAAGRLDEAEQEARKALKLDEKSIPAMVSLATVYHRKKRHELAKMVLENARQVDGRDPAVWNRLGFVEMALGNRAQALEHFKAAAALGPDYPEAHANYGAFLADAEDYAGAVGELELAVRYAPRSAGAWLGLGNAYRGTQQFEKAEQAYRRAAELDPSLGEVSFNLAVLYLDGEKPGTPALDRLEQAVVFFDAFEKAGGSEPKLAAYRKDAAKAIDRERKRLAREERDRLRQEAEAKKKEEEARKEAELAAQKAALQPAPPAPAASGATRAEGGPTAAPEATPPSPSTPPSTPAATPTATPTATPPATPDATPPATSTSTVPSGTERLRQPAPAAPAAAKGEERGDR